MAHFAPYALPAQARSQPAPGYSAAAAAPPDLALHDAPAAYSRMPSSSHAHSQAHPSSILAQQPASAPLHYAAAPPPAQQPHQHAALQARDGHRAALPAPAMISPAQHYHMSAQQHVFAPMPCAAAPAPPAQLWMGDIEPWMDDELVRRIWAHFGEHVTIKMIHDRLTGAPANYCLIEVPTHADAERLLAVYNGRAIPHPYDRPFRLGWVSGVGVGGGGLASSALASAAPPVAAYTTPAMWALPPDGGLGAGACATVAQAVATEAPEFSLFVGDLAPEVTDIQLVHEFRCRYASVRAAKVVTDAATLQPRGYGFVRFSDEVDHQRALVEMQGHVIGSRAIRVSTATPKRTSTAGPFYGQHQYHHQPLADGLPGADPTGSPASSLSSTDSNALYNPATDPFNTTVFVGGLMHPVSEDELHAFFAVYGEVVYCKIPPNRGCGFVTFGKRAHAETAMRALNGHILGGSRVRLSWGRSQSHARHNYRRHGNNRNLHSHQLSHHSGGSGSGANSHRNSVSEHPGLYSHRSATFGKGAVAAPSSAGLGLCLGGALTLQQQQQQQQQHAVGAMDAGGPVYSAGPGLAGTMQPSPALLGAPYAGLPSAFYALSPIHPAAAEAFAGDGGVRGDASRGGATGALLAQPLSGYPQRTGYYCPPHHTDPPQQPGLAAHARDDRDHATGAGDLLTRRLSALTLGNSAGDVQPPALDRRPSAGVIGQRRLSSKPSFGQQIGLSHKTPSQLSLAQLWSQGTPLGDTGAGTPLAAQFADYHGALSTPASSVRLSASSATLLALHSAGGRDPGADTRDGSARPSMDEQSFRRGLPQTYAGFELGPGTD